MTSFIALLQKHGFSMDDVDKLFFNKIMELEQKKTVKEKQFNGDIINRPTNRFVTFRQSKIPWKMFVFQEVGEHDVRLGYYVVSSTKLTQGKLTLRWGQFNSILPKDDFTNLLERAIEQSIIYSQDTIENEPDTTPLQDEPKDHLIPPEEISDNFEPDEILLAIIETYSLKNTPEWLALTDRRVMYLDKKLLGRYEFQAIPYMKMQNAIAKIGKMIWGEFIIEGEGDTIIHLKRLKKEGIISAFETMKKAINTIAIEPLSIIHKKGLFGEEWTLSKPPEMIMRQRSDEVDILNIIKQRFAKGEITKEEYTEMVELLGIQ
jgi:hypothetical protein